MDISFELINNKSYKYKFINDNSILFDDKICISEIFNRNRIYNPFIIKLYVNNKIVDSKIITSKYLDLYLYLDLIAHFRYEIFNDELITDTKNYRYYFKIDEEKSENNHKLFISGIKIIKKKTISNKIYNYLKSFL